jgi:hypothetical protein
LVTGQGVHDLKVFLLNITKKASFFFISSSSGNRNGPNLQKAVVLINLADRKKSKINNMPLHHHSFKLQYMFVHEVSFNWDTCIFIFVQF